MTASFTTSDGVRIDFDDDGDGHPILFVAGFTAPRTSWTYQTDAALAAGYRVVAIDRRSHGTSDSPRHGQRIARHAADVAELIAHLALERQILVGASMGASVLWSYLDLFGSGGAAGLVTIDQTPRMINDADWSLGFYGLTRGNADDVFATGVPETGMGRPLSESLAAIARLRERLGSDADLGGVIKPETLPLLHDHAHQDWRDVCARLDIPHLVLAGRDSQFWSCGYAEEIARSNDRARAVVFENCGHVVNLDVATRCSEAILDFARSVMI